MKIKKCSKCDIEKSIDDFYNDKHQKDGKRFECKNCKDSYKRKKRESDPNYRIMEADCSKRWQEKNPGKSKKLNSEYRKNNKDKISKSKLKYKREKRKNDPEYRLMEKMRKIIGKAIKNKHKTTSALIGLSGDDIFKYLQSLGYNSNTDHIDHIIPISAFDLTIPEHQSIVCYYKNLQPLSAEDNINKSNKLVDGWLPLLKEICSDRGIGYKKIEQYILNKYNT